MNALATDPMLPGSMFHEPVDLDELLDDDGTLQWAHLVGTCQRRDVVYGLATDEEMLLCGQDPEAEPDRHWQPWMARLGPAAREVALGVTYRMLTATGHLEDEEGVAVPSWAPPHGVLAHALDETLGLVTWRIEFADDGSTSGGAFLLPWGLALHDDIDADDGFHQLALRSQSREAAWIAGALDPDGSAIGTEPPVVVRDPQQLRPSPSELAEQARSVTVLARTVSVGGRETERLLTSYGTADGLWLLQDATVPEPVFSLQLLSRADILALAAQLADPSSDRRTAQGV